MECAKSISMSILRDVPCVLIISVILFCSVVYRVGVSKTCSPFTRIPKTNKRAQRALGRSPEEKVKGNSGANNRELQGHNLNNFGRRPFGDVIN